MTAYYNEIDARAAAWLRELIKAQLIAPGEVDERDIQDVRPNELAGYTQCHWFAGIGVWSYALRLAGWPDDRQVWTGSCPCQPFSAAGKGTGLADERHLWPAWFHLIQQRRPVAIFGEQVAPDDGLAWLDVVRTDLESASYAVGGTDLCAAGFGAPNIRQRLFFVAEPDGKRFATTSVQQLHDEKSHVESRGEASLLVNAAREQVGLPRCTRQSGGTDCRVADTDGRNSCTEGIQRSGQHGQLTQNGRASFWTDCDWLPCVDGKWRPVEPGSFPLVNGAPARMVRLRGYGNAINAEVAAAFIRAYLGE